jgi:3-hydroxyisobutyrate dehydrogenase-like beta-hydroxyacid dehydrogenase
MTVVGMIGLGIMGSAMSGHLLARGFEVRGFDVSAARADELRAAGGTAEASVAAVAEAADVVVTSLPTPEAALEVCAELAGALRPDRVVVETSTLSLEVKRALRDSLAAVGATVLDCPLSGTGAQALERDVVVYGSGDPAAFETVRPVLEAFSRSVRHLGDFGSGSVMKYVANLLVAIHNASTAEAFALGTRAGLDPAQLYETIRDGAGSSVIFERRGRLMVDRQYLPATAKVSMFVKDVGLVQDLATSMDLPTPMLDATLPLYQRAVDSGLAEADAASLLQVMGSATGRVPATGEDAGTHEGGTGR